MTHPETSAEARVETSVEASAETGAATRGTSATGSATGEVVGRYRVDALIATGGTATVHRAHDLRLGRDVALKRARPGQSVARHRLRLLDEGRLLAHLDHPGLVRVLDAAWDGPGAPYLVTELVDGPDLGTVLAEAPLEPRRAAAVGRDIASALAHLHGEGLVHRDVKPANVLLEPSGRARLCDLGVTLRAGEPDPHGRPGHTVGSIAFLAPEQVLGQPLGTAVDVYALGLLLLEALTGRREYAGTDDEAAWARVHRSPGLPVSLGSGWTTLLAAMTARDPADRPSAQEVATHLEASLAVDVALASVATVPGLRPTQQAGTGSPATEDAADGSADGLGRARSLLRGRSARPAPRHRAEPVGEAPVDDLAATVA